MDYNILETWGPGGPLIEPIVVNDGMCKSKTIYTPESRALQQCKNDINDFYKEGKWDDYKKITNPYEYIFLSWNRRSSRSVATRQPLSRSYFKMIELWKRLDLTQHIAPLVAAHGGFVSGHAAEGPGGFIEACQVMTDRNNWNFKSATAITLRSEAKNVPGWRKAARFLETHPHIVIHDGADGTGDILKKENQDAYVASVRAAHPQGVHLFTADGGFDFSNDYDAQEDSIFPLLLSEILLGLRTLARGGCMAIKCFDTTERFTLDLIWLTSRAFCEWGIVKPRTSRAGNAERYIVGKGFLGNIDDIVATLESVQSRKAYDVPILQPMTTDVWKHMFGQITGLQEQIEHVELCIIRDTLDLIKSTDPGIIRRLVKENVERSIAWCDEHGEETAAVWITEFERQIGKETIDLVHILNPVSKVPFNSYSSWHTRSTMTNHLTFDGFRTMDGMSSITASASNPFMRTKSKP